MLLIIMAELIFHAPAQYQTDLGTYGLNVIVTGYGSDGTPTLQTVDYDANMDALVGEASYTSTDVAGMQ